MAALRNRLQLRGDHTFQANLKGVATPRGIAAHGDTRGCEAAAIDICSGRRCLCFRFAGFATVDAVADSRCVLDQQPARGRSRGDPHEGGSAAEDGRQLGVVDTEGVKDLVLGVGERALQGCVRLLRALAACRSE
jgi:hypothetical protein